ncbi:DUF2782 domain-containing protein [Dyella sp. GSA-30]|uniref:DUF2782 domain-containing protein n=1 Tax=Dyella sp. GSA-30 TaxID=2994496 RepID=UPI002490F568|nr:DUF2782 domain-containing protein [Dyella sp. GSA-30]BDU19863.1 hypothetical protein DYGSA30_13200 [Dyella sp. GSA-30]
MKTVALLVVLGAALASSAFAQDSKPAFQPAPPPPGMSDPGVKTSAPSARLAPQSASTPAETGSTVLPGKPIPLPDMKDNSPRDARGEPPPKVNVYKRGEDTVQEYSRNGQVYMVVVTPKSGISQTYDVDPNGKYRSGAHEQIKPVMYKVAEWGTPKKQGDDSDNTPAAPPAANDSGH